MIPPRRLWGAQGGSSSSSTTAGGMKGPHGDGGAQGGSGATKGPHGAQVKTGPRHTGCVTGTGHFGAN